MLLKIIFTLLWYLALGVPGLYLRQTSAATTQEMGVHIHPTWDMEFDYQQLAAAKEAGATIVRIGPSWRLMEPRQGEWDMEWYIPALDQLVEKADELDIQVLFMLGEVPCWASGDPNKNCAQEDFNKWCPVGAEAGYARAFEFLVDRYGNRVAAWEVWNEPNLGQFWCSEGPNAGQYTKLLKETYNLVKRSHPQAIILGGSLAGTDLQYLSTMYKNDAHKYYDALALHPYTAGSPNLCNESRWGFKCSLPEVRELMLSHGDSSNIWFTEFGWSNYAGRGGVGPNNQVKYLAEAKKLMAAYDYVPYAFWYDLRDDPGLENDRGGHFGLYDQDLNPKNDLIRTFRNR